MAQRPFFLMFLLVIILGVNSSHSFQNHAAQNRLTTALQWMPHYECATAAVMAGLGDILAQRQTANKNTKMNWTRTIHFMIKGFGEGFLWTYWYRVAERWCLSLTAMVTTSHNIVSPVLLALIGTIIALVLDFTLACPVLYSLWDIPVPALLRGRPLREIPLQIHDKLGSMMMASLKLWTPINVLIYNAPVQYRVYIMSSADIFWQSIVSSITSSSGSK